jgi:parvulin-like peptidyl-prolyl isomerase
MSRLRRHLTALACVIVIAIALPATTTPARADETLDGIAAVVNEDVVLQSELRAEVDFVRNQMQRNGQRLPPDDVLRERILELPTTGVILDTETGRTFIPARIFEKHASELLDHASQADD